MRDDVENRKVKKLSSRLTRMTILIPVFFCLVLGGVYYDLKKSVITLRSLDGDQVKSLSKELNSRFSAFSLQGAKMEESIQKIQESFNRLEASFDKKVLPLDEIFLVFEKTTSALKKDLEKASKSIAALRTAKIDRSEVSDTLDKLEKKISPVTQDLKNMESEIKALDENLTQELAELSGNVHKLQNKVHTFEAIRKKVSALASVKLDKKGLETELKDQEKRLQLELKNVKQDLRKKEEMLKSMESQIEELMKFKALSEIKKRLQPAAAPVDKMPPADRETPTEKPASQPPKPSERTAEQLLPPPKPGNIIEENLKP